MPTTKKLQAYRRGHIAELLCLLLLHCKGYRVLHRRYRVPQGEIDLIAFKRDTVIFIEVKARATETTALESIRHLQRTRIEQAALAFMQSSRQYAQHMMRFDVMTVAPWRLPRHLADAWRP